MDQLYDKISVQMESNDVSENLAALRDIDELIDVKLGESASKVLKFSNHIRYIFEEKHDPEVLILGSKVLGHLARAGGAMTADEVEHHVRNALEWLRGERIEHRRFAAVLILKEMAENAPAVFYVHVPEFVDAVWVALRDPSLAVRERAVEALRACLCVMEKRETRWRVQWYYKMFEATKDGLGKNASVHSIHGSLLAVGELLRNTGEFMMSRYKEVADIVFKYREHKDRLVRHSITSLLPRIAHFLSDRFVTSYLKICMDHILAVLRIPAECASGFVALGEMAKALDGELIHYLPTITSLIRDAIAPRRGKPSMEALACIGSLAKAMGLAMETYVRSLLDIMFSSGLSPTLVESLDQIASSLPSLLPTIQDQLLDCISVVLSKTSYHTVRSTGAGVRTSTVLSPQQVLDVNDPTLIRLALRTLENFNFKGHGLLEFARDAVVIYLEDEDGSTRRDAAICCCKLVENSFPSISMTSQFSANRVGRPGGARRRILVEEVIEKLLLAAVADADVGVRKSVFASLHANGGFDEFLAQADSLRAIFIALNDEAFDVRELAISMAGRLSEKNPAYVLPALRRHLVQLLTELQQSADRKRREESAKLLGCLIRACERLLLPYIAPVHKALIAKLCESPGVSANNGVVTGVLATVGELARVGGCAMRPYLRELMPLILKALEDGAVSVKREVAVATLGQVVQSTGYVVSPYVDYPSLLGLLLRLLNGELAWSTRREVLKVLGIMGALDPHTHKHNQQSLQASHGDGTRAMVDSGQHMRYMEDLPMDLWQSFTTSEDYFSTVAINSLMRILRDPSLSSYHQKVVGSLMLIFKSMGLASVPYLPKVLPDLFHIFHTCEGGLKDFITWKLGTLVSIVRQHIHKYLPELLALISEFWSLFSLTGICHPSAILHLMEQLCLALNDEFQAYLPEILPCCIQVLTDAERCGSYSYVPAILHSLEIFGSTLDEHMHLLLPALIRIFRPDNLNVPVEIRRAAMKSLTKLIPRVQVSGHISALIQPLSLVLDGKIDELRKEAVDCICVLAQALGDGFTIFVPSIRKQLKRHHLQRKDFDEIEAQLRKRDPTILENNSAYKVTRPVAADVISDPLDDMENDHNDEGAEIQRQARNYKVNDVRLRTAWEASQRSTKEDWAEWMRHFSIELLKGSPSPALRTCACLAQLQPSVCRELFTAGFVSCWAQLTEAYQQELVQSLKMAFSSPNIPPEIPATLLNLAEFMEHDEKPLPIDIRLLGALAEKCQAFAKALHYKEMEFEDAQTKKMEANPVGVVEALIHINNQLHQHEAAVGILTYAQLHLAVQLKESWYENLQRWDEALSAYTTKALQETSPHLVLEATLGQMRCLAALARWEELSNLCKEFWTPAEPDARLEMAPMAASAAWNMGEWDQMAEYVSRLDDGDETKLRMLGNTGGSGDGSSNGAFFRAVLFVRRGKYGEAWEYVERARKCLATELAALVLESYDRAYNTMVRIQQLAELEEVIDYCTLPVGNAATEGRKALIRKMWIGRIQGAKRNVEVWQELLVVHALVLPPTEDADTWLKFASLCRRSGRISQARSTLVKLLQYDPELNPERTMLSGPPQVRLAYLKYLWSLGEDGRRKEAFHRLQELTVELAGHTQSSGTEYVYPLTTVWSISSSNTNVPLLAQTYLILGTWQWALYPGLDEDSMHDILVAFKNATECARHWSKAWRKWALFNTAVMSHFKLRGIPAVASQYVVAAVTGYFRSIAYGANTKGGDDSLQDILRLLTLWFNHGATTEVQEALVDGFNYVNIDTWLVVLPQIIARIHSNIPAVRKLIQSLLVRIGRGRPQALMYPLLVACKSTSTLHREATAAQEVVDKVRQHSGVLVDQAELVSKELLRVAILWHEMWHEALEEASRLYFGEHNIEGMLTVVEPLHAMLEQGPDTLKEISFVQAYGGELLEAHECCLKYRKTGKEAELTQAWDLYYHVFKRINKQLGSLSTLELEYVSRELLSARNLELAVPGTYHAGFPVVTIAGFAPQLVVIRSKQRPRRLTIHGSDGNDYAFLLKGHEDLRQDERVMQLFGLVNTLLANARQTAEKDLSIQRYDVIPLSPNSGLISWVSNCDTLHRLILEYREARKIFVNSEHRLMLAFAPDYEHLPLIAKIEVFQHALQNTGGNDLAKVLWLKSRTSEDWLDRRTNYTRSLAVMSMVGYLLGLGDRHPSNLMLHRLSGKIIHIDFGDCFEVSMNREKYPEKVPFRLTRMLVKAMGISGIEGNFISTCKNVMEVLRSNRDSVMAMMEAFVYDPLVNWRLFNINGVPHMSNLAGAHAQPVVNGDKSMAAPPHVHQREAHDRELLEAVNHLGDANEFLNERALVVMARMRNKLTGRDFPSGIAGSVPLNSALYSVDRSGLGIGDTRELEPGLTVKFQVQKLITQATLHENLCQSFVGLDRNPTLFVRGAHSWYIIEQILHHSKPVLEEKVRLMARHDTEFRSRV